MDYSRPDRAERLAAEYALGTLRGPARRRFERLLPAHPALASALNDWLTRLQVLVSPVDPVAPPERVWTSLRERLFPAAATARPSWWQRLSLWQGFSAASMAALVMMAVLLRPGPVEPPIVIILNATPQGLEWVKTGFVASVSPDGQALVVRPIAPVTIASDRALQLWSVPKGGAPRSLGLLGSDASATVLQANLLTGTDAFAVSLEPTGGSPTGQPTGPIVSAGHLAPGTT